MILIFLDKILALGNIFQNLLDDSLNLGNILLFMILWSIFLYLPLIWYLEKIGVGQFGIPLPFYFVFMVKIGKI